MLQRFAKPPGKGGGQIDLAQVAGDDGRTQAASVSRREEPIRTEKKHAPQIQQISVPAAITGSVRRDAVLRRRRRLTHGAQSR